MKAEDAPKSFADLLDPKWAGKIVKAHPGYSGTVMTATYEMARDLGWEYFEKLAKQKVMQVQSSTDPPKKLALGERAVMADGNEYNALILKESGQPGRDRLSGRGHADGGRAERHLQERAQPERGAAVPELLLHAECQQLVIDVGALRSVHPAGRKSKPGRKPFKDIKVMKDDPAGVEKSAEDIKARYSKIFDV